MIQSYFNTILNSLCSKFDPLSLCSWWDESPICCKWIFESEVSRNKAPLKCLKFQSVYTRCASFSLTALCPFWRIYFVAPSLAPALHKSSRLGVPKRLIIRLSCEGNSNLSLKFTLSFSCHNISIMMINGWCHFATNLHSQHYQR